VQVGLLPVTASFRNTGSRTNARRHAGLRHLHPCTPQATHTKTGNPSSKAHVKLHNPALQQQALKQHNIAAIQTPALQHPMLQISALSSIPLPTCPVELCCHLPVAWAVPAAAAAMGKHHQAQRSIRHCQGAMQHCTRLCVGDVDLLITHATQPCRLYCCCCCCCWV
jgi:hypothetical protein